MTEKKQRFTDNGFEAIEDQSFTDNQTGKTYYVDYFDEIVNLLNVLHKKNEQLKSLLECSRKEANDYCEELIGKDEFVRLYKRENEQLKQENNKIKNILLNKKKELESDYNRAAKAGMPTGGTIGELDTIEEILEEMGLKNE